MGRSRSSSHWRALLVGGIRLERAPPPREPPSVASLLSGFTYIRDHQIVLGAISLDLFAVLLGGATALLPVYARRHSCTPRRWGSACCARRPPPGPC